LQTFGKVFIKNFVQLLNKMDFQAPPQYKQAEFGDISTHIASYYKERRLARSRVAVAILFFVNGFNFANLPTRLPELQRFYAVSNTQLGLVLLCSSVGALAAMLFSGRIKARFGSRRVATVTALGFVAVPPFLTLIPQLTVLLPLFFILGAAIGSLEVAMNNQAIEVERLFKRPLMSSFHAVFSIGGGLGAAFGSAMTWGNVSIFTHFLLVAIGSVLLLIWGSFFFLSEDEMIKTDEKKEGHQATKSIRAQRFAVLPIALLAFGSMASEGTLTNWTAIFCSRELQANTSQSAFAYTVFAVAMTIGRLGGDGLTRRFGSIKLLIISLLVAFLGLTTIVIAPNIVAAMIGLAVAGLGFSSIVPLLYSEAGNTEGVSPSVGVATISILGYASFFIMPPVVGFMSDAVGLRVAMGVLLCFVGLMLGLVLFIKFKIDKL
jgi:fucose permease